MVAIRTRLFLILLGATGAIWLFAVLWIQQSTYGQVERALDARLASSAQMVASLVANRTITPLAAADQAVAPGSFGGAHDYSSQISCQIWQFDGHLLAHSEAAPKGPLSVADAGFSTTTVEGETWRVFTVSDPSQGIRVMVGDRLTVRQKLVRGLTEGLLLPTLVILPLLAGLIWLALDRGLAPLDRMAAELARQRADDLTPLAEGPAPREILPMRQALNGLIRRVAAAREAERKFTAFAAHELKTPLAGLKTQAQVAALAEDEPTRRAALARIVQGVDRTDRMVMQLLALARLEMEQAGAPLTFALAPLFGEIAGALGALAAARKVSVATQAQDLTLMADRQLLVLALRNLMENAIYASPPGSTVELCALPVAGGLRLEVRDRGPGIPPADRAKVCERFFRGTGTTTPGSGLGLPIVETAVALLGGRFGLSPRDGGGEVAWLELGAPAAEPAGRNRDGRAGG